MNPYWGLDFFQFMLLLIKRFALFCQGKMPLNALASDEIQILVLLAIGISSALVGAFLVLKKMTMLANALSHTILLGIILSYFCLRYFAGEGSILVFNNKIFFLASILTALLTTALTDLCRRVLKVQEEASIGLIFTFLFALGVLLVTLYSRNVHLGVEVLMGNIDALHVDDVQFAFFVALVNVVVVLLFFKYYQILTFDEALAKSLGCYPLLFQYLLMTQTAFMAISSFRAVGVFLFLIFLTAPVLAARILTHRLSHLIGYAALMNGVCITIGVALSRHILSVYQLSLSTGAVTCACVALSYPLVLIGANTRKALLKSLQKRKMTRHKIG
jgi:manganese/zinc/iron transport system permease protein